ncbi:Iron transport multicopper oxidase fetC [Pseudocercospora fuligena]|uniref:Iron transport multicopper oxidase fetC n=1 Tax=Pseudocercospora fuligena TaxID=685502 RepID=A0A8H6RTQ1_9PEZI|nr:Iron transport multicopper oxidase fetC [Pseudocercospora fuligena]
MDADPRVLPRRRRSRKTLAAIALLSTLIIAFFLLLAYQNGTASEVLSFFTGPQKVQANEEFRTDFRNVSRLNPEDHVNREPKTLKHKWRVTSGLRRPDGVLRRVYLVNGQFPGPTIEARSGDEIIIEVENTLEQDGISIHWHGLSMHGANEMDGVVGITQALIKPSRSFTYRFTIEDDQHGTFWWHSHYAEQRADGLYGGFVVHKPLVKDQESEIADERLLLIGDWYHRHAADALKAYSHPGAFGLETVPDSVVINGAGTYICGDAVPARPVDCVEVPAESQPSLYLDTRKRTIIRLVNVGAYAGFSVSALGSVMTALTVDAGHPVSGQMSRTVGYVQPGERVDVLLELDPVAGHYNTRLNVTLDDTPFKYENPALTLTHTFPLHWNGRFRKRQARRELKSIVVERFDTQTATSAEDQSAVLPPAAQHTVLLYAVTQKLARLDNEPRGFINQTTWRPQSPSLNALARSKWDDNQFVPHIPYNKHSPVWVDIILNNLDEDWHPFHLHGYSFWVLSSYTSEYNWGSYNPYDSTKAPSGEYDLKSAPRKDTFYVPRHGYAVLRFEANNPGLWAFHCHVLWHEASGMGMAFDVRY